MADGFGRIRPPLVTRYVDQVRVGELLEPMKILRISLAYAGGLGRDIKFALLRR